MARGRNNNERIIKVMNFHKYWTANIQRELGKDCTYCSTVTHKGIVYLKTILKNKLGGKDEVVLQLGQGVEASLVTSKDYKDVLEILKARSYDGSKAVL